MSKNPSSESKSSKGAGRIIYFLILAICLSVMLYSGYKLFTYYSETNKADAEFSGLADMLVVPESEEEEVQITAQEKYQPLYDANPDFFGWVSVEGTRINYPVMYAPDRVDYYLYRNFEKENSKSGVPYIGENCDPYKPSDNLLIHGHHMKNGSMFADLMEYDSKSFYEEHKYIQFDTLEEYGTYEVVVAFKTDVTGENPEFPYYEFADAENEEEFNDYINKCKARAFYDTGVEAVYGDKLITLSTCEYSTENGRLVVVAKRIENKE